MSVLESQGHLMGAIKLRSVDALRDALEAGANVNGYPEQHYPPIVYATLGGHADVIEFLLTQGADPDTPSTVEVACDSRSCTHSGLHAVMPGERALHIAARSGKVDVTRVLLDPGHASPNLVDYRGYTPLMATCESQDVSVEVVRMLLEAGADPSVSQQGGFMPLHAVARHGHMDLVDMLHTSAPATLNCCAYHGEAPLVMACVGGHESMVSKLLSLGARQGRPLVPKALPLTTAVNEGFVGVVRVLVNEGGIKVLGGEMAFAQALHAAIKTRQARILRLLLAADGEEERSEWANTYVRAMHLLHFGAGFYYPAAVSVLLEAGADEVARDSERRVPSEVIGGKHFDRAYKVKRREEKELAIRRMLQRGPAYRARSWAWPSGEEADTSGGRDGGDTAAVVAAGDVANADALSSPPADYVPPSVRIFRPKRRSSSNFFVRIMGRVQPRLGRRRDVNLGGLECRAEGKGISLGGLVCRTERGEASAWVDWSVKPTKCFLRNPGQYERLLGDEPVRTYVPLLLRSWAMDCAHKEAVHLGEKVGSWQEEWSG